MRAEVQVMEITDNTTIKQIQDFGAAFHSQIRIGNEGLGRLDVFNITPGDYIVKSGERYSLWCATDFEDIFGIFEDVDGTDKTFGIFEDVNGADQTSSSRRKSREREVQE